MAERIPLGELNGGVLNDLYKNGAEPGKPQVVEYCSGSEQLFITDIGTSINLEVGSSLFVGKGFWYVLHPRRFSSQQQT